MTSCHMLKMANVIVLCKWYAHLNLISAACWDKGNDNLEMWCDAKKY